MVKRLKLSFRGLFRATGGSSPSADHSGLPEVLRDGGGHSHDPAGLTAKGWLRNQRDAARTAFEPWHPACWNDPASASAPCWKLEAGRYFFFRGAIEKPTMS